jgi:arginine utilization protein RocB
MSAEMLTYVPIFFSGITLLVLVAEKVWGGGNALAAKFHKLDKETAEAIAAVRRELSAQVDEYEKVSTVGFEAIKANIHALQLAALEFRARMSEDLHLYIRKDDYNAGVSDIKRDVQAGFQRVDERLGQLQDLVMYSNGDAPRPVPHQKARA